MQLSKRAQYGLRALVCLCEYYPKGYIQTKELAAREGLPTKFLESILSALARAKFLSSKIGATGGYRLAKNPREIMIGEVMARLEGKKLLQEAEAPTGEDQRPGEIAVEILQAQLSRAIGGVLESGSLASLVELVALRSRSGQMYYI